MLSRTLGSMIGLLAAATLLAAPALAQDYPRKQPIRIIVPVPAGGGTDALARATAEYLQRRMGQTVIVENKPGASSTIGADFVAKSPADGYTLLFTGAEFALVPAVRPNLPYRYDEMTYLVRTFNIPALVWASPKYTPNTVQEMVADMKARPGQVRYGSTGIGAIVHLGVSTFESALGVKALHVPYSGIAPVFNDLLAGTIDFSMGTPPFPDGIKVIGSVGTKRHPGWPTVPTLEEQGIKGASWGVWFGFLAPPNLPKPIADRLIAEINAVIKDPEAIAKYQSIARHGPEAEPLTGDAFKKQAQDDFAKWKAVVDREKIVVQ
jgi:tripartite-type tricarboxylate transporter receptor subunit TctC